MSGSITSLGWIDLGAHPDQSSGGVTDWAIFQDGSGVAVVINTGLPLLVYFDANTLKWADAAIPHQGTDFILPPARMHRSELDEMLVPNVSSNPYVYDFKNLKTYQPPFFAGGNIFSDFSIEFDQGASAQWNTPIDLGVYGYCFFYCEQAAGGAFFLGYAPSNQALDVAYVSPQAPGGAPSWGVAFHRNLNRSFPPPGYMTWNNTSYYTITGAYVDDIQLIDVASNYLQVSKSSVPGPGAPVVYANHGCNLYHNLVGGAYVPDSYIANGLAYYQSLASTGGTSPPMWQPPWIGSYDSGISQCVLYYYSQGFALPLLVPPPQPTGTINGFLLLLGNPGMVFWIDWGTGHIFTLDFNIRQFALHNTINLSRNRGQ